MPARVFSPSCTDRGRGAVGAGRLGAGLLGSVIGVAVAGTLAIAAPAPSLLAQARQGNASAQEALGRLYLDGTGGLPHDPVRAVAWFMKAAEQGDSRAERHLGWCYWKGEGVSPNATKAAFWLRKAAASDPRAMNLIGAFRLSPSGGQDPQAAVRWFMRGARAGFREAMFNLGALYDRGVGVPVSYRQALQWWRRASALGDTAAMTALGDLYEKGLGLPRDYGQALAWYRRAAARGSRIARESLAAGPWSLSSPGPVRQFVPTPPSVPAHRDRPLSEGAPRVLAAAPVAPNAVKPLPPDGGPGSSELGTEIARLRIEVSRLVATHQPPAAPVLHGVDVPDYRYPPDDTLYAVVIGISRYPGAIPQAPYALEDARAVARHFEALGVPADHLRLLTDGLATRGGIDATLSWLARNLSTGATVWFYYSGHGATLKGDPVLAPSGVMAEDLPETGYPVSRLLKRLRETGARRALVILDACFSGRGARTLPETGRPVSVLHMPRTPSVQILAAAGPDEEALVDGPKGHGLMTYYLLRGLNREGKRGSPPTLRALYDYLRPRGARAAHNANAEQRPELSPESDVSKDMVLR